MRLLFQDYDGSEKFVAESDDGEELENAMMDYIDNELHFKSYYTRGWFVPDKGREIIDYGSHTRFFVIEHEFGE